MDACAGNVTDVCKIGQELLMSVRNFSQCNNEYYNPRGRKECYATGVAVAGSSTVPIFESVAVPFVMSSGVMSSGVMSSAPRMSSSSSMAATTVRHLYCEVIVTSGQRCAYYTMQPRPISSLHAASVTQEMTWHSIRDA